MGASNSGSFRAMVSFTYSISCPGNRIVEAMLCTASILQSYIMHHRPTLCTTGLCCESLQWYRATLCAGVCGTYIVHKDMKACGIKDWLLQLYMKCGMRQVHQCWSVFIFLPGLVLENISFHSENLAAQCWLCLRWREISSLAISLENRVISRLVSMNIIFVWCACEWLPVSSWACSYPTIQWPRSGSLLELSAWQIVPF